MKSADLPTGCDSYVSSLTFSSYYAASSTSGIFTAGKLEKWVLVYNRGPAQYVFTNLAEYQKQIL